MFGIKNDHPYYKFIMGSLFLIIVISVVLIIIFSLFGTSHIYLFMTSFATYILCNIVGYAIMSHLNKYNFIKNNYNSGYLCSMTLIPPSLIIISDFIKIFSLLYSGSQDNVTIFILSITILLLVPCVMGLLDIKQHLRNVINDSNSQTISSLTSSFQNNISSISSSFAITISNNTNSLNSIRSKISKVDDGGFNKSVKTLNKSIKKAKKSNSAATADNQSVLTNISNTFNKFGYHSK